MIAFIKRNTPVFIIAFCTLALFLILIGIAFKIPVKGPKMLLLGQDTPAPEVSVVNEEKTPTPPTENPETTESTKTAIDFKQESIDQRYGIIIIEYTDGGFYPNNIKAVVGQRVIFKNTTTHPITIQQVIKLYDEFADAVLMQPGAIYELRLTKEKLWTFKEKSIKHYGSIFTVKP